MRRDPSMRYEAPVVAYACSAYARCPPPAVYGFLWRTRDNGITSVPVGLSFFPCAGEAIAGMDFRGAGAAQAWERLGPPGPLGQDGERLSTCSHDNKDWLGRHQAASDIASNIFSAAAASAAAAAAAAAADAASAHTRPPDAQRRRYASTSTQHRHSPLIAIRH